VSMLPLQAEFAQDAAKLIQKVAELGYTCTLGEAYRTPEQALWNAQHGTGIVHSLHIYKLAIDLNLFKNGAYITDGTGHTELGAWWKTLSPMHRWGGDFAKKDYNHYSISPDGVLA
jgi:hypothetical protein